VAAKPGSVEVGKIAAAVSQLMGLVEGDGYDVSGFVGANTMKAKLRGAKDANGSPIFQPMAGGFPASLYGENIMFSKSGGVNPAAALLIAGDFSKGIIGIRRDMVVEVLREATITSGSNAISLAQNDLVGLKFTFRLGFQVATPATQINASTMYPFAVLKP